MAIHVDDKDLVAAHRAGDTGAFDQLARYYRPELLRHAYRRLSCAEASEDAVQETLVRAYRALPKLGGDYRLGPWLHRILANVCVDEANRRSREGEKTERVHASGRSKMTADSVEEELGLDFDYAYLEKAFNSLSPPYREALTLKFVDELEYDEVAHQAGVSEENARARVSRARSAMRTVLKGVAVFPILCGLVLRRGEKAAGASTAGVTIGSVPAVAVSATSSNAIGLAVSAAPVASAAMPTLAEATITLGQIAPAALPVLAKAAVGLGLAAAVLAPASDSAMHQVVEDFGNGFESTLILESTVEQIELGVPVVVVEKPSKLESKPEISAKSVLPEQLLEIPNRNTPALAASSNDFSSVNDLQAKDLNRTDAYSGVINSQTLEVLAKGAGRFTLEGSLSLTIEGVAVAADILSDSQMWIASESVEKGMRIDGLLSILLENGVPEDIRIAGFAQVTEGNTEWEVSGLYRSTVTSLPLIEQGSFVGYMNLSPNAGLLKFTLGS